MIRWAEAADVASVISTVQYRAVREGRSAYTEAQRAAWIPEPHPPKKLAEHLTETSVAIFSKGACDVGVMTLAPGGYINMAFILPDHQGTGVFRALLEATEERARVWGEAKLSTHASLMAQPAFQAMGFQAIHHETVERAGEQLSRALMEKPLT